MTPSNIKEDAGSLGGIGLKNRDESLRKHILDLDKFTLLDQAVDHK